MTEIAQTHIWALARALEYLLGPGEPGALAFVRCLPPGVLPALLTPEGLTIPGWDVHGVGVSSLLEPAASRVISADKAVEIREDKKDSVLLLVDPRHVGSGMDGIYSAGREIREDALLNAAIEEAERGLPRGYKGLLSEAARQGRRLLGKAVLSPWIEFLFYGYCCEAPERFGELVTLLGLWPIARRDSESRISREDLEVSAQVVTRLLLAAGAESTPQARVASLFLPQDQAEERAALEAFLAEMAGSRWTDAVRELRARPALWLNRIRPGFIGQSLVAIELDAWRAKPDGTLHAWSGLKLVDGLPTFLVPEEQRSKAKLQVRWRTVPRELPPGSLTYEVTVVTGAGHQLAARQVPHAERGGFQRCVLTVDDFEDVEEGGKWEAFVQVHPTGYAPPGGDEAESQTWTKTEDFVITFGPSDTAKKTTAGRRVRALVEEAISLPVDQFLEACNAQRTQDSHGFVSLRVGQRSARVHRPALLRSVEESWQENDLQIGRWTVRVRDDGSRVGDIAFQPLEDCKGDLDAWRKLQETTRSLGRQVLERLGFVGVIYHQTEAADRYVNAWAAALETSAPQLALAHTIEVQRVSGQPVGLIVLPSHPIRVAWHQAYDELAYHARYIEEIPSAELLRTLAHLAGSHFPMFLPGLAAKETLVFGDMLGFMAVAMISAREPEPQAAVAHLSRALSPGRDSTAASVGTETSEVIAGEIARYSEVHPDYTTLRVNAVRAGDAFTTARALGSALRTVRGSMEEEPESQGRATHLSAFTLDLFPSNTTLESGIVGRFLSETAERRRSGAGTVSPEDVWITERVDISGVALPKLMWSKRGQPDPDLPAHLAIAFDTFNSDVIGLPSSERPAGRPIEAYGLAPSIVRSFSLRPVPRWRSAIAAEVEGTKHPAGRGLTERLQRLHANLMSVVATNLGHPPDWWPFLGTEITADRADSLNQLHQLTDWVLTVDRNMGLEYFDSPRDAPEIYDTYVIDSVPERHDLDCVQLVTSTVHVDEVLRLLDRGLTEMGLSFSPRHCSFLLSHLKALSGRLAMRFTHLGNRHRELIALALFHANCQERGEAAEWLSAADGFFVPLDDIRDLVPSRVADERQAGGDELEERVTNQAELRADLAYVNLSKRGALRISFVEIKYRRLMRTAVSSSVLEQVGRQLRSTRQLWRDTYSSQHLRPTQLVVRRRKLARALRFYCDKARRHGLARDLYDRLCAAIDRLHDPETDLWSEVPDDRAYLFCPEHTGTARQLAEDDGSRILLFGPLGTLPLPQGAVMESVEPASAPDAEPAATWSPKEPGAVDAGGASAASNTSVATTVGMGGKEGRPAASEASASAPVLGLTLSSGTPVVWPASIRGNPHIMIVGRPGMGKTTSIVSLCEQLLSGGLNPIVFSFHPDLEARLEPLIGPLLYVDIGGGLGFNPLRVVTSAPHGWIDNVGMVRDIFAAIYPDLGEIQTNELRAAIKQSYEELGYGVGSQSEGLRVPSLDRFYELLRQKPKPNKGLLARLDELSDYGLFRVSQEHSSLLDARHPVLIRLHTTPNEVVQNFVASFVLFSIYQAMFLRGEQPALSHVVVVDEAHRASRLKLLPTMAKECRKFGVSLVVASQEAKDFHASLFAAVVNYLVLNVGDADAQILARYLAPPGETARIASELRSLAKFTAYFFSEGRRPSRLALRDPYQAARSDEQQS